jgi:asparagine synthase (glutamine-hydrolysing)
MAEVLPDRLRIPAPAEKIQKFIDVLGLSNEKSFYRQLVSHWASPGSIVLGAEEPEESLVSPAELPEQNQFEAWMMATDTLTYLPDDILAKVDRAAMANSLEARVPLLDHRVVELAWSMPMSLRIRNHQSKWLLRQVLYRHVPQKLVDRPKMGFGVPIHEWLRGPLRDWAEALLSEERLRKEGYLRPEPIRQAWCEHLRGVRNWHFHLWDVLMFQAWLEQQ